MFSRSCFQQSGFTAFSHQPSSPPQRTATQNRKGMLRGGHVGGGLEDALLGKGGGTVGGG